jgi:hypothetical protein
MTYTRYWVSVILDTKKPHQVSCTTCEISLEEAMKIVQRYRKNYETLVAWVEAKSDDAPAQIVYFECFVDCTGQITRKK